MFLNCDLLEFFCILTMFLSVSCGYIFEYCSSYSSFLSSCNFIKKESPAQMFSCEFCKISKKVGFRCEPVSLYLNKVCFGEEQDIPNTREKSRKSQSVTECGKWHVMHTNVKYLSCCEVEAFEYFQLSDMRYNDKNISPKELVQQSCKFI